MLIFLKRLSLYKKTAIILIFLFFLFFLLSFGEIYNKPDLSYGVTFSNKQATDLGLDWKEVYLEIFDDLGVKKVRLAAYWDEIEKEKDVYDWDDIDWQINEASKRGVEIILAAGGRLPRWPECHFPDWALKIKRQEREGATLKYLERTVFKYKDNKNIVAWQIENEPFLSNFGECPEFDKKFLDKEIELVKKIDSRPIIITDSGELSSWVPAAKRADIFGTTMYRDTYSNILKAYIHYPIEPSFFKVKRNLSKIFASPDKWLVIELQGEPWGPQPFQYLEKKERDRTMSIEKFRDIIEFSRQTGFKEYYLWGVEWWYWEKQTQNNPEFWEEAKKLF